MRIQIDVLYNAICGSDVLIIISEKCKRPGLDKAKLYDEKGNEITHSVKLGKFMVRCNDDHYLSTDHENVNVKLTCRRDGNWINEIGTAKKTWAVKCLRTYEFHR
jgi:hypothetical protein